MRSMIRSLRERLGLLPPEGLDPEGAPGVTLVGHRKYVGGCWEEVGALQFDFLLDQGLQPRHHLLDIGCGALRLGVKAIPYLEPGHYLGIEKEASLLQAGVDQELGRELLAKRPRLLCDHRFRFHRFRQPVEMAMAQSLFTHLPQRLIERCLRRLRPSLVAGGMLCATFFEVAEPCANPRRPHDHGYFAYTRAQMEAFGERNGYVPDYLGDWNHPRGQVMVIYRPRRL